MEEKIDKIMKEIGDIKTDVAVIVTGNEFLHTEVTEHKKILHGNGRSCGIKNQVRVLWTILLGALAIWGIRIY